MHGRISQIVSSSIRLFLSIWTSSCLPCHSLLYASQPLCALAFAASRWRNSEGLPTNWHLTDAFFPDCSRDECAASSHRCSFRSRVFYSTMILWTTRWSMLLIRRSLSCASCDRPMTRTIASCCVGGSRLTIAKMLRRITK